MASAYSKRLAKLEELLASKVNRPLAYLWLNDGETREECCIRAGYDPSQIDRFCRWLDPALDEIRPEYAWDQVRARALWREAYRWRDANVTTPWRGPDCNGRCATL